MKKLIIIAAALLVAWSANAQIGIVAGVTSSSADINSAVADVKNINQYHFGLAYKLALGGTLAIQPALIYNMKGKSIGEIGGVKDVEYKTGYLELPVQVQLSLLNLGIVRAYGLAEPFVGYAITNEVKGLNQVDWDNVKTRFEDGVGLGAGVELFKHLQVAVKYFWNLGDIYGKTIKVQDITNEIASQKCDGIAASLVILF